MALATACLVDERKFVGFSFENNFRSFEKRSRTLVEEGKELVGHNIGYWLSGLCSLCFHLCVSLCLLWLPNCVIYILQVDQRIVLKLLRVDIY